MVDGRGRTSRWRAGNDVSMKTAAASVVVLASVTVVVVVVGSLMRKNSTACGDDSKSEEHKEKDDHTKDERRCDSPQQGGDDSNSSDEKVNKTQGSKSATIIDNKRLLRDEQECQNHINTTTTITNKTKKKIRILCISMGGERQRLIKEMFSSLNASSSTTTTEFEVDFSPGILQRNLRNREGFIHAANEAGLIPANEYRAFVLSGGEIPTNEFYTDAIKTSLGDSNLNKLKVWNDVPIHEDNNNNTDSSTGSNTTHRRRRGSEWDLTQHYTSELWRKGKSVGRDRPVLACLLAHLIAMKRCVNEQYDVIIEDNVRVPIIPSNKSATTINNDNNNNDISECARRVLDAMNCSESQSSIARTSCGLRYYGWLGSERNLRWVFNVHAEKYSKDNSISPSTGSTTFVFPFPTSEYYGRDAEINVGGTCLWGAYGYWISKDAYEHLMETLRHDVGSMLWRGKRMRNYCVKPIDKILPRIILSASSSSSSSSSKKNSNDQMFHVDVSSQPTFFRAPMLTSRIHTQWDPEFCKSTQLQLTMTGLTWKDLWLTKEEQEIVQHHETHGTWITTEQLKSTSKKKDDRYSGFDCYNDSNKHLVAHTNTSTDAC